MRVGSGDNSIITDLAFGIRGEFDMDALAGTLDFNLPYHVPAPDGRSQNFIPTTEGVDLNNLRKFDTVELFFNMYEEDPGELVEDSDGNIVVSATGELVPQVFDGFIDDIRLTKTKSDINYSLQCMGTLGLSNYRQTAYNITSGEIFQVLKSVWDGSGLEEVIPFETDVIAFDIEEDNLFVKSSGGKDTKRLLMSIVDKYVVIIHQRGDGKVMVLTPFYLLSAQDDEILNVNSWEFSLINGTIWDLDYGSLTSIANAVVVIGDPPSVGVAVDTEAVSLNNGVVNYQIFENRTAVGEENCQQIARNKLLEMERNNTVTFKTIFQPEFTIGQPFTIVDGDRFTGNEIFFIKKYAFTIAKNDVSCTVTGYNHSLTTLPEDIVISNTGVADVDVLGLREKIIDTTGWQDALS